MPATLDRDMLSRMGVFTCKGSLEVIAGRKGKGDVELGAWTKRARDRLEMRMDGLGRQSTEGTWTGRPASESSRELLVRDFIPWVPPGSQ